MFILKDIIDNKTILAMYNIGQYTEQDRDI